MQTALKQPTQGITLTGLSKSFGDLKAVDALDLSIRPGELVVESSMRAASPLMERETDVLRAAADGASVDEVAAKLFLSTGPCGTDYRRRSGRPTPATAPTPHASPATTGGCDSAGRRSHLCATTRASDT